MAYDEFDKKLGEILRAERDSARLSQQDMADRLGLTKMTISHWEKGNRSIKASSLSHCYLCRTIYGSAVRLFRPEYERFNRRMT